MDWFLYDMDVRHESVNKYVNGIGCWNTQSKAAT